MKLQYLGTAAAEGIPAIFCECENCVKSRGAGGKNIRTRSQALIDDTILIDLPPDTYMHFLTYSIPLSKIKSCLVTHSHQDHLYPEEIVMRKNGFSHIPNKEPLVFYSDKAGVDMINEIKKRGVPDEIAYARLITPCEELDVEGYRVTPLRATHDVYSSPVVFIIEKDGKSIFYSNDTSEYPEESMEYLKGLTKPLDLVSFDCTEACRDTTYAGHLCFNRCVALRDELIRIGAANEKTLFVLNHFSHNGKNVLYDDFKKIAAEKNFEVSFDGMIIEI